MSVECFNTLKFLLQEKYGEKMFRALHSVSFHVQCVYHSYGNYLTENKIIGWVSLYSLV